MKTTKTNDNDAGHECPACRSWPGMADSVREPLDRSLILEALLDAVEAIRSVDRLAETKAWGQALYPDEPEATVGDTVEELLALVELLDGVARDRDAG